MHMVNFVDPSAASLYSTCILSLMQRSIMSFDEEAMELAYKSLESTESFCEYGNSKKFSLFGNSSLKVEHLSPHQRLHRRAIVADCILFESVLVFLKQGLTSYVKGGYLLRKAYKMYEKIFHETENLCRTSSPISRAGMSSRVDAHVGSSIYDDKDSSKGVDEEVSVPDDATLEEAGEDLSSLHIGFVGLSVDNSTCDIKDERETCAMGGGKWVHCISIV